jgi:phage I-like protein
LRSALHKALRQILTLARSQLYEKANIDRTKERTSTTLSQIEAVAQRLDGEGATKAANAIRNAWQSAPTTKADQKRTVKRYTVAEIYDVVVAAVEDEVDARTFNAIMKKLSEILAEG